MDNWPLLEQWFSEPENILIKVNAEIDKEPLCEKVKEIFTNEIMKKKNKGNYIYYNFNLVSLKYLVLLTLEGN